VTAWLDGASAANRSAFLARLDLAYFLRRVNYVNHRGGVPRAALGQMADVRQRLIRLGRALRSRDTATAGVPALRTALTPVAAGPTAPDPAGTEFVAAVRAVEPVMQAFAAALDLDHATTEVAAIVNTLGAERVKRWEGFDEVDEATLALRQLIPGENKDIAVVRVSPRDATSVCDERHGQVKLAGAAIHHWWVLPRTGGGTTSWGRLDASSGSSGCLSTTLQPARSTDDR
jgi:hypothetical protein